MSQFSGNSEFALIDWIRQRVPSPASRLRVGIGDDAAELDLADTDGTLLAVDMLVEGIHFTFPNATPRQVGHKALAVNLSDIAAMGGTPLSALVSVVLPRGRSPSLAEELHEGLIELAEQQEVSLIGGDTTSSDGPLVISVTVVGLSPEGGPVLRSGARPDDVLLVTGALGGSRAGHHLDFSPRTREAQALVATVDVHAMIDISDGLAADLSHLLAESDVGAVVSAESIPIRSEARDATDGRTPLSHALGDGEDFELLLAVTNSDADRLLKQPPFATALTAIGKCTAEPGGRLALADGRIVPLPPLGWQHSL